MNKNYSTKIWKDTLIFWQNQGQGHWNLALQLAVPMHFQTSPLFNLYIGENLVQKILIPKVVMHILLL